MTMTLNEILATIEATCKDVDPEYVGRDKLIIIGRWVDTRGGLWKRGEKTPTNPDLGVFFIFHDEDSGILLVYAYPISEKAVWTRYRMYEPLSGTPRDRAYPIMVEEMNVEAFQAELVEHLLDASDSIVARDAARSEGESEDGEKPQPAGTPPS